MSPDWNSKQLGYYTIMNLIEILDLLNLDSILQPSGFYTVKIPVLVINWEIDTKNSTIQ